MAIKKKIQQSKKQQLLQLEDLIEEINKNIVLFKKTRNEARKKYPSIFA